MKHYHNEEEAHKAFMDAAARAQMKSRKRKEEKQPFNLVDNMNSLFHTIAKVQVS